MSLQKILSSTYKNKTVFITGHNGFIGTWLTLWLQKLGANVVGYSLKPNTEPSFFRSISLDKTIENVIGDIRKRENLLKNIKKYNPDFVIHLAAQSLVKKSYENPVETFQTNILGTVNVLDAIRKCDNVKACIVMTSDKCYHNPEDGKLRIETDPMGGNDPYSASKGSAELVVQSFKNSFFKKNNVGIATIRAGNVLGGGDWSKNRIVPDCINSIIKNKKIVVRNPSHIRPWQFVLEPISGMLLLGSKLYLKPENFSEGWNLGPKKMKKINVKQVVNNIIKIWGNDFSNIEFLKKSEDFKESNSLLLNSKMINRKLGWETIYTFDETIKETVSWYKQFYKNSRMIRNFSIDQISKYVKKANKNYDVFLRN
jgi:CDP-glucose 4,6-dehydratase